MIISVLQDEIYVSPKFDSEITQRIFRSIRANEVDSGEKILGTYLLYLSASQYPGT